MLRGVLVALQGTGASALSFDHVSVEESKSKRRERKRSL